MVIVIETPFITTPTHIIVGMRFGPQTLRGTQLVNVHTQMPRKVNIVFVKALDLGGGGESRPLNQQDLQ
jgi:hypothetical protein